MNEPEESAEVARAIVTGGKKHAEWLTKAALREAVPDADVTRTDFHAVYRVERPGDVADLCRTIVRGCPGAVGHLTALVRRLETDFVAIREAAVALALEEVEVEQSFAFRIHKRGARGLDRDTPELEKEIGAAIWEALEKRHGTEPEVELEDPEVRIVAEVLGPASWIGFWRAEWAQPRPGDPGARTGGDAAGPGGDAARAGRSGGA